VAILAILSMTVASAELEMNESDNLDLAKDGANSAYQSDQNDQDNRLANEVNEVNYNYERMNEEISVPESNQGGQCSSITNGPNKRGDNDLLVESRSKKPVFAGAVIFASGHCGGKPAFEGAYPSGMCHNFPTTGGGKYGAKFTNSCCDYKVWEKRDCKGKSTYQRARGNKCIAIANNEKKQFYLRFGGASISITCK
jgi:hypothetical protein